MPTPDVASSRDEDGGAIKCAPFALDDASDEGPVYFASERTQRTHLCTAELDCLRPVVQKRIATIGSPISESRTEIGTLEIAAQ